MAKKVCIIGGGVAGVGLLWTLAQPDQPGQEWDVTLIHDGAELGGHALTVAVPDRDDPKVLVDTGVQFFISLLYPNIEALVKHPGITEHVPVASYDDLKVACGFPRRNGQMQNWGNFDAYRGGTDFAMYTEAMYDDAKRFQDFIDLSLVLGWGSKSLAEYFDTVDVPYSDQQEFLAYFVDPYLSIINGYGASLSRQVTFDDLFPLFANLPGKFPGLGSFTQPGSGYRRFVKGASSLVQAMADQAQQLKPAHLWLDSTVLGVTAPAELPGPIRVTWGSGKAPVVTDEFDKVVFTTDMHATASFLDTAANAKLWEALYSKYLDPKSWPLLPGKCYIHRDVDMLSPDLRQQQETLQFTAYYAPQEAFPSYDMYKTYTTYIQKNLHPGNADADGLYLTMYGYLPDATKGDKVPDPDSVVFEEEWTHGMWLPTFMLQAKRDLHLAQGKGVNLGYPGQLDTNIYFAGNNTTADSLEHAFISGAVIANYAFGAKYPLWEHLEAWGMYELFYKEFMFPAGGPAAHRARLWESR
jgi:hypothetical protein